MINNLNYYNKGLGDTGVLKLIRGLNVIIRINRLDVGNNEIGDTGAIALANFLAASKTIIYELDLKQNDIGPDGAMALARMLKKNKTLIDLNLIYNNPIGEDGIIEIANALKYNNTLQALFIDAPTDKVVIALANAIKRNKTLVKLVISTTDANSRIGNNARRIFARSIALARRNIYIGDFVSPQMIEAEAKRIKLKNFIAASEELNAQLESIGMYYEVRVKILEKLRETQNDDVWLFDPPIRDAAAAADAVVPASIVNACLGCFVGEAQYVEQHDPTRQFCSSYCQLIHYNKLPDVRGMTPAQIKRAFRI